MENEQLKKKIEEILRKAEQYEEVYSEPVIDKLLSLCKKYALSVLPKYDLEDDNLARGFNQCIKQAKKSINERTRGVEKDS